MKNNTHSGGRMGFQRVVDRKLSLRRRHKASDSAQFGKTAGVFSVCAEARHCDVLWRIPQIELSHYWCLSTGKQSTGNY
jgi:hypothetical protein